MDALPIPEETGQPFASTNPGIMHACGHPPTINDAGMAEVVRRCAVRVVGEERVVEPELTMGGEDMSFFLKQCPGCYYNIGVGREGGAPLHSSKFDFKEELMLLRVETHCRVALDLLGTQD